MRSQRQNETSDGAKNGAKSTAALVRRDSGWSTRDARIQWCCQTRRLVRHTTIWRQNNRQNNRLVISRPMKPRRMRHYRQRSKWTNSTRIWWVWHCFYVFVFEVQLEVGNGRRLRSQIIYDIIVTTRVGYCDNLSPLSIQQTIKHEMLKQQHQIEVLNSTDANQKRIEESISNLEAESQNMNSRVQQLYMQLLHEIVKKKDIELDSKTVDKKLLNQTVHLYELEVTLWVFWFQKRATTTKHTLINCLTFLDR